MKKRKRPAARKVARSSRKKVMRHTREGARRRSKRSAKRSSSGPSPSGLRQQYLDVLAREFPTTLKVMRAYPSGRDDFKPHERSYSAARLVHTFTQENGVVIAAIRGELKMPPNFPPPPATLAEAVAAYERGARALIETVREMPDSRLFEKVTFFTGPRQMGEIPIIDIMWLMLMDSVHHRGQLSVYVRMAGGRVPSIYGPSADEPWM
jgi:uncharacterized damage-inducible protein DinB